jgi:NAD(P)-dependent dehydrogenase (short-subunit alcohol dehydrogenase family)
MDGGRDWWVLVGGRSRVGRRLAELLAGRHNLVLTSSRSWKGEEAWLEGLSTGVRTFCWDAGAPGFGSTMMADLATLGPDGIRLSSAVLVAGEFPTQTFGSWKAPDLDRLWRVNVTFPMLAAQALAPVLAEGGCLQFLLDAAIHRPFPSRLPYTASKAALAALVPGLAKALAPGARVVGHAPGTILPAEDADGAALARATPLGRNGAVEDLARALEYAAASTYLTGEILTLDGGWRLK